MFALGSYVWSLIMPQSFEIIEGADAMKTYVRRMTDSVHPLQQALRVHA